MSDTDAARRRDGDEQDEERVEEDVERVLEKVAGLPENG